MWHPKTKNSIGMGFSLDAYYMLNGFGKRSNKLIYCCRLLPPII